MSIYHPAPNPDPRKLPAATAEAVRLYREGMNFAKVCMSVDVDPCRLRAALGLPVDFEISNEFRQAAALRRPRPADIHPRTREAAAPARRGD